jgi:hypothetical protein
VRPSVSSAPAPAAARREAKVRRYVAAPWQARLVRPSPAAFGRAPRARLHATSPALGKRFGALAGIALEPPKQVR